MAKYIPETKTDWAKWLLTLILGAAISALISYYFTKELEKYNANKL